jgi:molybdenum cofactor synthesis domain-containing protein
VAQALRDALASGARLIVTTGGTGVGPRDQTPEGTERVVTRQLPGIAEELRRVGLADTRMSVLSRGIAGVVDPEGALVVNLPGSTRAVASGIPVIVAVARHVLDQVTGGDHS